MAGFAQFHVNHPFPGRIIEMETSLEVSRIKGKLWLNKKLSQMKECEK